jgi:hypothetical protein
MWSQLSLSKWHIRETDLGRKWQQPSRQTILLVVYIMYDLNSKLAAGKSIPKWDPRARVGLYLGPSPRHARNLYMVLSLDTGVVSHQFHMQHDDLFETASPNAGNPLLVLSHGQTLSGLRLDTTPGKARHKSAHPITTVTPE